MRLRSLAAFVLALLIAVTAQAAAVAHAAPGPTGRMEICTGTGPVMVYTDETGAPTGPPVYCPDFALSLVLALDLPAPVIGARDAHLLTLTVPETLSGTAQALPDAQARGPPRHS